MAAETMRITEELVVSDRTGPGLDSATRRVSAFDRTVQETQSRLNKMSGSRWNVTFGAVDKATSIITGVESRISHVVGKAWNFTVGLIDKVTSPLQSIFNLLRNPILQAGAVLGVSISVSDAISTFGGFESAMSQVRAISGASGEDMEQLTALAKEMGATTKFTAEEAAQGLTYMAMAGWKTEDMMTSLSGVMNLAAASGEDLATVSDIVTDAMTAFGMAADGVTASGVANATHFSDVLAAASSNANTTVTGMGETFKYVGSMAGALGYNIEDVALATGLMANSGIKGTMAGTALNSMLTRLSTNTSGAADAISELGVEFYNADGSARNLGDVMGELRRATVNMTAAQKSELANTVAGTEAQKGLLAILNTSEEDYNSLAEAIYNADGAAQQMSDTMLDNMQGSMTLLQSAVDGVKLSLGSRLSPYVRQFADWLTTKMPAVETVINNVMDTIDGKIEALRGTIAEFTGSEEWANADIWGKISIAWDKIVAEPFGAWWDSTGKPWMTEKVAGFGESLGSGITAGLLAILGFDASGAVEDGKSIGASFIEGFKQGFDTEQIGAALTEWAQDHKGIVAAAGVIAAGKLIGGMARAFQTGKNIFNDLSSLFGGSKGGGVATIAEAITGGARYATSTMTVMAGTVVVYGNGAGGMGQFALPGATATGGALSSGLPMVQLANGTWDYAGGATATKLANLGVSMGSGATTATGAAAAGAAGLAGGIAAGVTLISSFKDFYNASKSQDSEEAAAYNASGGLKMGGVAAGALVGTAILPGVGTLIGAGIGGIAGWLGGNAVKKDYAQRAEEAEEAARMLALAEEQAKYESIELKAALADTSITAEQFAAMVNEKIGKNLSDRFGDIRMTASEIEKTAEAIIGIGGSIGAGIGTLSSATSEVQQSYQSIQVYLNGVDKLKWKIGIGLELSDAEMSKYIDSLNGVYASIQTYLDNTQYEATAAITLLVGDDAEIDFTGLNTAYDQVRQRLEEASQDYFGTINVALEDGAITLDEQAEIMNLQSQLTEIMAKVSSADWAADMKVLEIKYNGAALDYDSFTALQAELATQVESATAGYDQALKVSISALELQLSEGVINQEEYDAQLQQLADSYTATIDEMTVSVEKFQIDAIADAFTAELDQALPQLQGTASEKITQVLETALAVSPDPVQWSNAQIDRWFNLDEWSEESRGAFERAIKGVAETLPASASSKVKGEFESMSLTEAQQALQTVLSTDIAEAIEATDLSGAYSGLSSLQALVAAQAGIEFAKTIDVTAPVNVTFDYTLKNPTIPTPTVSGAYVHYEGSSIPDQFLTDGGDIPYQWGNANGGFTHGPELSWIGEDGPEAIIPLGAKRRSRGLALYEQVGDLLGVEKHADGGIAGSKFQARDDGTGNYFPEEAQDSPQTAAAVQDVPVYSPEVQTPTDAQGGAQAAPVNVPVSITLNPEIIIQAAQGMNEEDIVRVLRDRIRDMVDDISDEMAERLARVFANMPLKGGA